MATRCAGCGVAGFGVIATEPGFDAASAAIARGLVNGMTLGGGWEAFGILDGKPAALPLRGGMGA